MKQRWFYHASPYESHPSILQEGLHPGLSASYGPPAVYVFRFRELAENYTPDVLMDVWKVDLKGHTIYPDPEDPAGAAYTERPVSPKRLHWLGVYREGERIPKAEADLGRIDFPSEEEFLKYHRTGYIESRAYERYEEPGGLRWVGRGFDEPGHDPYERWPILLFARQYGPHLVEFRQSGQELIYTKLNAEGWPVYGPDGRAIMLTPEEIRAKGLIETSPNIAVFVGGETVGLASDEWGAVGVFLERPYQHFGIGTDLLVAYLQRHPYFRVGKGKLGQMTSAGMRLAKAAYRKMRG